MLILVELIIFEEFVQKLIAHEKQGNYPFLFLKKKKKEHAAF